MKKMLITLFIIQMIFVAAFASAECVEKAKLVGTWERVDADPKKFGEDMPAAMQAIEAGEKKLEEVLNPDIGLIDGSPGASEITEFLESGDMKLVASMSDILSGEDEIEGYYFMTMKGTWSVDCAQLSRKADALEKVDMSLDHLTDEQKKNVEQEANETKEMIAGSEERVLRRFGSQPGGEILYLGEKYALIKDAENDLYMIFQKK